MSTYPTMGEAVAAAMAANIGLVHDHTEQVTYPSMGEAVGAAMRHNAESAAAPPLRSEDPTMSGIYDDGAAYGPDPEAQIPDETPTDPIYDDGAQYGADRANEK